MKRRLQSFFMGRGSSSSYILAKWLLPSMAETCRTHGWSLLLKYTVPLSSLANAREFVGNGEIEVGRNLHLLPSFMDRDISSKGSLSSMADAFRNHDWPLLLRYTAPLSSMGSAAMSLNDEEIDGGKHMKPISISDEDLQLPSFHEGWRESCTLEKSLTSMVETFKKVDWLYQLEKSLPSMAETIKKVDWSLLKKFNSTDSMLNIEDALKLELAAICVWFLFSEVPPHVKDGAARTLHFISLGTSEATKLSIDQTGVENLMVRILSSGNAEVQRQLCFALSLLANCPPRWLTAPFFGAAVQDVLLRLACNLSCDPDFMSYPVLNVVTSIAHGGNDMGEKVVKTELLNSWLVKLLSREQDDSIMARACWLLSYIAYERCGCEFWDHVKENFLPLVFKGRFSKTYKILLLTPAVHFLLKISKYGSWDQIDHLVKMGGLTYLVRVCAHEGEDQDLLEVCLDAVEAILRTGDAKVKAKADKDKEFDDSDEDEQVVENEYADMIDDTGVYEGYEYIWGWYVLLLNLTTMSDSNPLVDKAERMVQKYRPDLDHIPVWKFLG